MRGHINFMAISSHFCKLTALRWTGLIVFSLKELNDFDRINKEQWLNVNDQDH